MSSKCHATRFGTILMGCVGLAFVTFNADAGDKIKVYRVPKEAPPQIASGNLPAGHPEVGDDHAGHNHGERPSPKVIYTTPEGWHEVGAGDMRVAGFTITGPGGQSAQVAVTPLPGLAGKESLIVNMWRQQVGLGELSEAETAKELTAVDIGGDTGKMFDMAGKSSAGAEMRIVTAMVHKGATSWFFKLQGDDALITAQKPTFIEFLKSIKISETAVSEMPPTPVAETPANAGPEWKPPTGWKAVAPGEMQVAKFSVPEVGGAKADVTISVFPSATGGTLANVNRWRRQIGLPPVDEAALAPMVKPLDEKIPEAVIADLSNDNHRLLGAIVPGGGQWYFYKLLGDAAAVASQKDAFTQFVKEVKY